MSNSESSSATSSPSLEAQKPLPYPPTFAPLEQTGLSYNAPSTTNPISAQGTTLDDRIYDLKSTLTELLNSEAVRKDEQMRSWCQTRLMEAELELKRQRRGRVTSLPSIHVTAAET